MAYTHGTIIYLQVLARSSRVSKVYDAALRQSHESTFIKVFRNPCFRCLGVSLKLSHGLAQHFNVSSHQLLRD